jgi:phosphate-selective porin OprO and OprP
MKKVAGVLVAMLLMLVPYIALAQSEGGSDDGSSVPLGVEQRAGKLVFESKDGAFKWWFDSRMQIDGAMYFENKNALSNGTIMRRATFAMKTTMWKNWQAELDMDFGDCVLDARDIWVKYTFSKVNLSLQAGNFKEPFGLERLGSSRLLTFMERSAVSNAFPLGRRMGFSSRYWTDWGQLTLAVMGHELGTKVDKGTLDEGFSTNARLSLAPINEKGKTLHIGLAGSYKTPDVTPDLAPNVIELKARTETYVFDPKPLHTGDITDVNYYNRLGAELAGACGPWYLQSELMATQVHRWYGKSTGKFVGAYITASCMLTGESRAYYVDEGEFGPTDAPTGTWGALELALRASYLNLNDNNAGIKGGKSNQYTAGLNWMPNVNVKITLDYSWVTLDENATSKGRMVGGDAFSFLQMRFQASI